MISSSNRLNENVLIKAELDDKFLTEVEKKYRSKVKRREE